jgi:hypothetical protein
MSASVIRYRKLVTTDVASQAVNLAESGTMGHRVQIPVSVDDLNTLFIWDRPAGSDRPVGHFNADSPDISFDTILSNALSKVYTDIDGMTNGLNFSSAILDANTDTRIRKGGNVLANDLVMCYVIYKCYGSSAAPTEGVVYNLQDAHDMLSNGALVSAIHTSMANEEVLTANPGVDKGSIDAMFRDLLAADPSRFFDAAGKQIPGLFETVADNDARGNWCFVENDKIEIAVQMRFVNNVTRQAVGEGEDTTQTVVIPAGATFKIRLQLVATDTPSGAAAKQEIAQANTSAEIVAQAEAAAKAAANAATAQRASVQAVSAAAAQSTTAQARYQKAVEDNAKQASAVAKAQAALKAAQAALNQAVISGKTDSDIQNQRAAAVAAQALVENLEAIADIAAADLQNTKLAADSATASLAAAQTAAATAAANLASANAVAAIAAKKKADDAEVAAAIAKAAADAASDPLTQAITNSESVILDPQTLVKLDAAKNAATNQRVAADTSDSEKKAKQMLATEKYNIIRYNIDYAISLGKNDSEIQVLRSQLSRALADKTAADLAASATQSTLTASYDSESRALSMSIQAKKDAAVLSARIASANTSEAIRKLNVATNAYAYASTITSDALEAANQAQATLNTRIAGGATFNELQTRRKAVLDANTFLAECKVKSDAANATLLDSQSGVNTAQNVKAAADAKVAAVNTDADFTTTLYQSTMAASATYQAQKVAGANANQLDLDVTNALIKLNIAKDKSDSANAVYSIARRNLDAALADGKRLSEITAFQKISQEAQLEQQRSDVILQQAQTNYNKYVPSGSAATAILNSAAQFQSTQVAKAKAVTEAILYNSTLAYYLDASANLTHARMADEVSEANLVASITGGLPLAETTVLRSQKIDSSDTHAKALAKFNSASAAMSTVSVNVTANPNVSTILYSASVLRESEIATAKSSDLMRKSNEVFTEFIKVAYETDFNNQNGQALKDMLATALAGGKSLSEVIQLQESLVKNTIQYANNMMKYEQLNNEYNLVNAQVAADPSLVESLANSYNIWNYNTVYSRASQDIKNLTDAQISKNTAQTDLATKQAEYDVITEQVNTAIRQGQTTDETATLTSTLNGVQTELANKMAILNIANKALSTAQGNWNTVKTSIYPSNDVSSIIQTQNSNYTTIASTLTANVNYLERSISSAKSNMLTKNLTQTYIDMIHLSTLVTEDYNLYDRASKAFDAAIAQGQTLAQIQGLRLKLQEYSAKKVTDSSDLINKTAAYQSSLQIATQSQDAKGILDLVAQMQATVLKGAQSNELLRNLIEAKNVAFDLSVEDTAAQSELLLAQSALQIATANGTIVQEKYDAIVTASNKVATIRNKLSAANAAVALANSYVNMDPNVQALQDLATTVYNIQNESAQANILSEQYFEAKKAEATAYAALDVAKKNLDTAAALFDTAISSGTDINAIQKARDELNAAASQLNAANSRETYAKAALNTALANANLSQTAQALITTARVTDDNVVAGANVTTQQYNLDLLTAQLDKATIVSNASTAASVTAKNLLDSGSSSGMTAQEIVELRENASDAAQKASDDLELMRNLQEQVLTQQGIVNKYTVVYQGTQAAVAQNNLINYMLFNGFSFQQSIDRYVLNKDRVPATVVAGLNIILFSQTVIPVDMGVYSDTAIYPIGNIVTYPDDSSAQYMCLVGTDPRGEAFSKITGKNPVDVPIVWAKIQEAQLRYRSATDLAVENFTKTTNYSVTVPLTGDMLGLKTLFINSDANGSNTLINGLSIFGDSLPNSTPVNPATITGIAYNALRTTVTISFSQPLGSVSSQSVLYIKSSKSIVDAAVLAYNTYVTNLLAAGFTPVTALGSLTNSVMNRSALPTPITVGTPFSIGTTTVTPTSKGVYSAATSYRTGDVVTDTYGSVYMCTVGPDSRGTTFAVTVGNAPVEAPGASVYWYTLVNQGWDTLVYDSATDLQLTPVAFGTGQVYWTSADFPANPNMQLAASFLTGYTVFGTGVYQRNVITNLSYGYSGATYAYIFTCGETNKNTSQTFYVKNGKSVLSSSTTAGVFNTLSTTIASAASQVNTILSKTTTAEAAAVNANIVTLRTSIVNLQTFYAGNTAVTPGITLALSIMDECVKAGQSAANLLSLYFQAVAGSVTGEIADLTAAKTSGSGNITTIVTAMNTASTHYTNQNLVGAQTQLTVIQNANVTLAATSTQYEFYFTAPTQIGYTLFDTKGTPGGNQGLPMGTSLRAYIETPTQSNLWNIDTSDYTLEFIVTAGVNFNNVGQLIDRFVQPISGTILMGLNAASNSGTQFALANWSAWRGLLGFNGNNNTWGPLFTNATEERGHNSSDFMPNASNIYNFGKNVQNHYCEVRKNNVQTVYLNGNQIMQYSNIYSAPSNSVILPSSNTQPAVYGPTPPYWQIGGSDKILNQAGTPWVGGLRNIRLSKEAVYTSSFNTSSTIKGPNSVYFKNLECLSTTILLMPMNDGRMLKDYSLAKLRVSTMGFSSNINSNIKFLSSFATVSSFTSLGINPVCYLPLSTNTSNIGTDALATTISGTVNTYSTISLRSGVVFSGVFANCISANFNPTSNLTFTCWYYHFGSGIVPFGLYGSGRAGSIAGFYNTFGSPENSGTGFGWFNVDFEPQIGGLNPGYGENGGIGGSPEKPRVWNQLGFVVSTNTITGVATPYAYINGVFAGSNGGYGPGSSTYAQFQSMNKVTVGRRDRSDGQQVGAAKGVYKDLMVFNRPFTASQMISLYTEQLYNRM